MHECDAICSIQATLPRTGGTTMCMGRQDRSRFASLWLFALSWIVSACALGASDSAEVQADLRGRNVSVAIFSPSDGAAFTAAEALTVEVSASGTRPIARVELYDGAVLKGTDAVPPFAFTWSLSAADNGDHALTAKA